MQLQLGHPPECRETLRHLQAYLDGECDQDPAWRVARHLSACEDCFADADAFRRVVQAVAQLRCPTDPATMQRLRAIADDVT